MCVDGIKLIYKIMFIAAIICENKGVIGVILCIEIKFII